MCKCICGTECPLPHTSGAREALQYGHDKLYFNCLCGWAEGTHYTTKGQTKSLAGAGNKGPSSF